MGFSFRRTKKLGPFRFTLSRRGVSGSVGTKRARVSRSTSGHRGISIGIFKGLRWSKRRKR